MRIGTLRTLAQHPKNPTPFASVGGRETLQDERPREKCGLSLFVFEVNDLTHRHILGKDHERLSNRMIWRLDQP